VPSGPKADIARQERLDFLECMERVNSVVQSGGVDIHAVMSALLNN